MLGGTTVPAYLQNRQLADRGRPQRQGPAHGLPRHQQHHGRAARLPEAASASRCCRTIWSRRTSDLVQLFGEEEGPALDAYLRLSGRAQVGRACAGVPRLPGEQRAALELLSCLYCARPRRCQISRPIECAKFFPASVPRDCELRMADMLQFVCDPAWLACGAPHCMPQARRIISMR